LSARGLLDPLLAVRTAAIGNGILIVTNRVKLRFGENNGLRGIGCGMFCWRFSPLCGPRIGRRSRLSISEFAAAKRQMNWAQAATRIKSYLESKGCTPERIVSDLEMARQKFQPWLD
jgi:hypothetical protein